ncbi:synaptotagmin-like protein 2 isoform 2-T2 [Mantella aurantiaca]
MVMKAHDESISKVLDWFSRSSDLGDNPPPPVGMLQPSKGTTSQILIQTGANEKESGPNENNLSTEPTCYGGSPNTSEETMSRLSVLSTQNCYPNSDISKVEHLSSVSFVEDNPVPPGELNSNSKDGSPLQYGKSGGGYGKISSNETTNMQDNGQCQKAKYVDIFEEGTCPEKNPKHMLNQDIIPVATESMLNRQNPEMVEKPHSEFSLSSTDTNNDQMDIKNDELLPQASSIENSARSPRLINLNLEGGNCLEFGKSGGGSGKTSSPIQEISEVGKPRLSLSSEDSSDHDQSNTVNVGLLTPVHVVEEESIPPANINLETENSLEFGNSEDGSGKISSPSKELSEVRKPRLSLSIEDSSDHDQSNTVNVGLLTPVHVVEEESIPPANINLEAENSLEFGNSGGGTGKITSPSKELSEVRKPRLSLSSTGSTGDDQTDTAANMHLLAPVHVQEEESVPPANMNVEDENPLAIGKSESESGKISSPSEEISEVRQPRLSLSGEDSNDLDQSSTVNEGLLTPVHVVEKETIPTANLNLEAENPLEFGNSGGGSSKTSSPSKEFSEVRMPRLLFSSEDSSDYDQPNTVNVHLTPVQVQEEESVPSTNLNLETENPLEFGKSGGGIGKKSSPSQEISEVRQPRLSLSSEDASDHDLSDTGNVGLLTPVHVVEEESIPPANINLEAENSLEFGNSGGGSGKISSPSKELSEVRKPRLSVSSTDSTGHDQSDTVNVHLLTPIHVQEEESVPPASLNLEAENPLEFGNSGAGSSKMSNHAVSNMETDPQLQEVKQELFDEGDEELKDEKESVSLLKEESLIQRPIMTGIPNNENGQLDGARPQKLEHIEILEVPPSQNAVKSNVQQRKVTDLKQLWESDGSALPAAKTNLGNSKVNFSPNEISVKQRSNSVESDDQSSPSIVTFKRVMVEEEEADSLPPISELKSFWENEKNKEMLNAKPTDSSSVKNGSLDADKVSTLQDPRSKFKKRHTFQSFFEKEPSMTTNKNPPGRSVSLSESANDNLKDRQKSTTFQNLRIFWNVDNKAKSNSLNPNDQVLSDSKNRQFRSTPDLSKESFVAKIKSKLESQSVEDIREDAPATYQVQSVKDVYNSKNKTPHLRSFTKQKSNSSSNSVEVQDEVPVFQDHNPLELNSVSDEIQPKSQTPFELSDNKKEASEVVKFAQSKNEDRMDHKEPFLVKQFGFDAAKSPVEVDASPKDCNLEDKAKPGAMAQVDHGEQVRETVEITLVPPRKHSADFDRGLQKLYNESLEVSPAQDVKLSQKEFMNIQSPEENFSKVLTVSSGQNKSNIQRTSSEEKSPSFQQPIVINFSSKKMNVGNEDPFSPPSQPSQRAKNNISEKETLENPEIETQVISETPTGKLNVNLGEETETSFAIKSDHTPAEEQSKKEIVERIEIPTIVPRAPFNYFDEGLKKLYDESRDLTATKPASDSLQTNESVTPVSQAPHILQQEIGETIEEVSAPTKIYRVKSSEKLQKEAVNDEEEPFIENVPSDHVTLEESQPRFSEHFVVGSTVSEMSPKEKEASVESLQYEESHGSPSKTDSLFTAMRESTPMMEKNNPLRRSTLELFLEAPYRREMCKSMDFELGGNVSSDVDEERCMEESNPILNALKRSEAKMLNSKAVQEVSPTSTNQLNSSNPTEDTPAPIVNTFPQNADTLKRLSQSVPAFIQDETDGRDTDSASESSFQIGRHKKSPSSLTNLSGSSGMASMSSVSGSVMSIYSGDFGNVDIKGGIEFSVEYVEQLKEFLIYIYQCRDLAAAEVKKQRSDPYVKAYLLPEKAKMGKRKTAVKKKTLNPVYNEILRYKIPKQSLLAQTLNLSVWHHDALGRNSFLGEVNQNLGTWDWSNAQRRWYQLEPRTPAAGMGLENRGEMKLSLKYAPMSPSGPGTKPTTTGEVYIWIKDCLQLPMLRENKINSFVKCTVLPDTSRKSRQKTRTVDKTPNPIFNHTMVYDGFKEEDLREACVELTVWDHNRLSNHFLGGLRIGLGTGKSYGTAVDWMDSTHEETTMWEKMMASPNTWIEGMLPLRMFKMAKLAK